MLGRWVADGPCGRLGLFVRVVYSSSLSRRMEKQEGRREEKVQPVKDCGRSWPSMGSPGLI